MFARSLRITLILSVALLLPLAVVDGASASEGMTMDIPYEMFTLDNGLTLIVHEDHKAPIVAVNIWYHVGSKNEKPGRTGFAHLFEHLMFNGSENYDDDYFQVMAKIGATRLNGTTNEDRTNYFQNVPTSALDVVLWMESDRMGHLLGAVTEEKLVEQRGVVQNEKRQSENQPYALSYEKITEAVYPVGHPYSWTVIGKMEDLDAAELDDVHQWFKDYYGTANAVIVLAGDIDAQTAKEKVERYFGHIPSGPPVLRPQINIAKRTAEVRESAQDRVPHARIYKVWNVPEWQNVEADYLDIASSILASDKNSRLYKRLVYEDQIATRVTAYVDAREIGSLFQIEVTARADSDLKQIEAVLDEELARFLRDGPTEDELRRVKTANFARFVRRSESVGGFGGKSDILASNLIYAGNPAHYKISLDRWDKATASEVRDTARKWLSDGVYVLEIHPFPDNYRTAESDVDRTSVPEAGPAPSVAFPKLQRAKLSNGMQLILAERHATPIVEFDLKLDAGYASDQFSAPGTAQLAMNMLDEGTASRTSLEISEQLAMLGATLGSSSNLDMSTISMNALKVNLDDSLTLMADVVLNPSFPQAEFDRLKKEQYSTIENQKVQPFSMALRVFPGLLYGKDHAYGTPFTGSGTKETLDGITRNDLLKFHETWFRPNNATMVIVGDTTMDEIKPKLERLFRSWKKGKLPEKNLATVAQKSGSTIYLVDKPGAIQSVIFAGHVAPPRGDERDLAIETMNTILGGTFIARLNMNLREDKHWSYGAQSVFIDAQGQRPFLALAPVQTDKTKESMMEIQKELEGIIGDNPVTDAELAKIKDKKVRELPGSWETNGAVGASIAEMVRFGLDDDYFDNYANNVKSLSLGQVDSAAKAVLHPKNLVWVVVGDREVIEAGIRELGLGDVHLLDADGNEITTVAQKR